MNMKNLFLVLSVCVTAVIPTYAETQNPEYISISNSKGNCIYGGEVEYGTQAFKFDGNKVTITLKGKSPAVFPKSQVSEINVVDAPVEENFHPVINADIYKVLPRLAVLEWGEYAKGTSTTPLGQSSESRDYDFELALTKYGDPIRRTVTSKGNWFVNGMFFGENRFAYGNLTPETEYWFRIIRKKAGAEQTLTTDTTYLKFVTPAEPKLAVNTVLYNDFDHFNIKGNYIYRAYGIAITNTNVGANLDPTDDSQMVKQTSLATPTTSMDALLEATRIAGVPSHAMHYSKCPKVWNHFWETDKYGFENITDATNYPGWVGYGAREFTGAVCLGYATAQGYIKTPFLTNLGEDPVNITIKTNTCAYYEPYHSWGEDCLYHYIQIEGPGKIVDAGPTKATGSIPATAQPDSEKSVLVKVEANSLGASKGPKNDWNQTTAHTVKVEGATKDTRVIIKSIEIGTGVAHGRMVIDDLLITKD